MIKNTFQALSVGIVLSLLSPFVRAAEKDGVTLEDIVTVKDQQLKLNGMGTRVKSLVKVYVAGLYLKSTPTRDAVAVLSSEEVKRLDMHFILSWIHPTASKHELMEAFKDGLEHNCKADCSQVNVLLSELDGVVTDMKGGDKMSFVFYPDSVEVSVKGREAKVILGTAASQLILAIFLGENPPSADLKRGLLGI